ncbi:unnamed protein product [marine sediment metagenome]|uniref:Uncharacterized protein n=1 Tax=marine sediment metagenome TaxID=412755 RepID=X0XV53_9ZZZZ
MGKKAGKAGKVVPPAASEKAEEPVAADPGKAAEEKAAQSKAGKDEAKKTKPHKPPPEEEAPVEEEAGATEQASEQGDEKQEEEQEDKTSWIEIELVGEDDEGIPGEKYRVTLPDGETVATGTLDEKGFARVEGFAKGTCKVCFPDLDKDAWEKI